MVYDQIMKRMSGTGIRFQMFAALNSLMVILVTGFLFYDYHGDRATRLTSVQTGLNEEARLLWLGASHLSGVDPDSIQALVDDALGQLHRTHASQHIVLVSDKGRVYLAATSGISESHLLNIRRQFSDPEQSALEEKSPAFMTGSYRGGDQTAVIAEDQDAIESDIQADLSRHVLSVLFLAVIGAFVINFVVSRIVIVPLERLVAGVRAIERGDLGTQIENSTSRESAELAATFNQMSRTLAANQKERAAQMEKARRIQEHLHPGQLDINGVRIATVFRPLDEIAGDFFDFIPLSDERCLVCIADMSGHGVSAALNAVMLKVLLLAATQESTSPADVLKAVDAALYDVTLPEMFATMVVLRICADSGVIDYASAGHESVWLQLPNGDLRELSSTGPPVGTNFGMEFEEETFNAVPGTRLLLATDGVTEAAAPDGTLFSKERLRQAFSESTGIPLQSVLTLIENRVDAHRLNKRLNDDLTLLAVEIIAGHDQA